MSSAPLLLLNCTHCDDVLKLVDQARSCECGRSRGAMQSDNRPSVTGPARVFTVAWEFYDGLCEGTPGPVSVLSSEKSRGSL